MAHLPGKFVWFEHVSNDIAAARAFYEKLFDWNTEVMAMQGTDPYVMIHNGEAGIGGYAKARPGAPTQWMSYLSVQDVDSSYKAALAAGAKSVAAPTDYGSAQAAWRRSPTRPAACSRSGAARESDPPESRDDAARRLDLERALDPGREDRARVLREGVRVRSRRDADARGQLLRAEAGRQGPRRPLQGDGRVDADDVDPVRLRRRRGPRPPSGRSSSARASSFRRATCRASAGSRCTSIRRARRSRS